MWKEKIRKDYKNTLSDNQIEETIKYWQEIIDEAVKEERYSGTPFAINRLISSLDDLLSLSPKSSEKTEIINNKE